MNQDQGGSAGFWAGLVKQLRLVWRLLWDARVPAWTKLIPFLGLIYVISPIDFIPDPILGLGQLDDIGILLLGLRVFLQLVPEEIVLQHVEAMGSRASQWRALDEEPPVIDAEYDIKDD